MSAPYTFTLHDTPDFTELIIERGVNTEARARGFAPPDELAAFVRDNDGIVRGGVNGEVEWGWLYIDLLWLDDRMHGNGHGLNLMRAIEGAAAQRGCKHSWLATTSFQALPFYYAYGYRLLGVLEDRPPGYNYYFLRHEDIGIYETSIRVTDDPDPADLVTLRQGLAAHSRSKGATPDAKRLSIYLEDDEGAIYGGLIGATYWGWLDIQTVWIKPQLRGQGYGAQMLALAEAESVRRGCPFAFADVADFQALGFFERQGYTTFATLPERPPGHHTHFMRKSLRDV